MDPPNLELPPQLLERAEATMALQEAMRDLVEELEEHPELARRFDAVMDALNRWLAAAAIARDD